MESKQLTDYPSEEQAELKTIMAFMVRNNIIQIKRWGGDMELSLHSRDRMYAVDMGGGESKIGGDARTPQHRGDNMEITNNAKLWLKHGHRGLSSEAIFSKMTGMALSRLWQNQHPCDPADFKRCMDLLDWVPEFANRMQEMKEVSEQWVAVFDHWDELVELYNEECDTGTCQKLYDRMKKLGC